MASDNEIQVEPGHYDWSEYNTLARWESYWHQIDQVLAAEPATCLEVGGGTGDVRALLEKRGVVVTTVDIDDRLGADRVGSVTALPAEDGEFDVAVCAQVLEHIPWAEVPAALGELARVSRSRVVVSLPQSGRPFGLTVEWPWRRRHHVRTRIPGLRRHRFDGQHHWQVGAPGTRRADVRRLMEAHFTLLDEFEVVGNSYHRFYALQPRR